MRVLIQGSWQMVVRCDACKSIVVVEPNDIRYEDLWIGIFRGRYFFVCGGHGCGVNHLIPDLLLPSEIREYARMHEGRYCEVKGARYSVIDSSRMTFDLAAMPFVSSGHDGC